jgi:acyl transferase domain-containing protein
MKHDIAIIGMACRFPEADDLSSYWELLCKGREAVSFFTEREIEPEWRHLLGNPRFVRAGAVIEGLDRFDAGFFGFSPREAQLIDPQHRLFLEACWSALEDAGYGDPDGIDAPVGVYAGSWASSYRSRIQAALSDTQEEYLSWVGTGTDFLTTLISHNLNLRGESVAVRTVCSTSLVAVHLACQSLLMGNTDMALAGGVSIDAKQKTGYLAYEGGLYSSDGRCRPFDRAGSGTTRGSGLGVVVLKRLADALSDRDHIYALIKGTSTNNDGRRKPSFHLPSVEGIAEVAATALALSEVDPESISLIEAHGSGSPIADALEVEGLSSGLGPRAARSCALGSVKGNFGDTVEACGVAGLIKVALSLSRRRRPPTVHFREPNPRIGIERTPFFVSSELLDWSCAGPRRAAVNALGIGGTNAHAVLEEAPARALTQASGRPHLLLLSALAEAPLAALRARLAAWLREHPQTALADLELTLSRGRKALPTRWCAVVSTLAELVDALESDPPPSAVPQEAAPGRHVLPARPGRDDLRRAASVWRAGGTLDWSQCRAATPAQILPLPTYPFQRQSHWLEQPERQPVQHGFLPWTGCSL